MTGRNGNTELYLKAAKSYFLPCEELEGIDGFVTYLGRPYFFHLRKTPFNEMSNCNVAASKYTANRYLHRHAIPVPDAVLMNDSEFVQPIIDLVFDELKYPVVIKPNFGGLGTDVLCNIKTKKKLIEQLTLFFQSYPEVIIEEYYPKLKSYRVLLYRDQIIGLVFREGAFVIGDGKHSIQALIEKANEIRATANDALQPIMVDEECRIALEEQGLALDEVVSAKRKVRIGYTSNASRGGVFESLPLASICRENRQICRKISKVLALDLVGIDVECEDIGLPFSKTRAVILEVNHCPSIKIHENPLKGKPTVIAKKVIRSLIYRHPFAYLSVLYRHPKIAIYIKTVILFVFIGILSKLLS